MIAQEPPNNAHLSTRQKILSDLSNKVMNNPDAAFVFMQVVSEVVDLSNLCLIQTIFTNSLKNTKVDSKN